jgi:hypothetical protein
LLLLRWAHRIHGLALAAVPGVLLWIPAQHRAALRAWRRLSCHRPIVARRAADLSCVA